ncbi:hypothetical protein B0T16DRAFT_326644 [Cercophora newfieldiana]|uniref:Zn(2)-C6 fungal-type domain-containing protein n=1 Tax=Cercophora newfieldiana TaxID=92897 RepID=A0AA39YBQ6_9PEZI|nr:hypothetical protein B0T16DRAFT_326644 [Cercophora newfieldiana]
MADADVTGTETGRGAGAVSGPAPNRRRPVPGKGHRKSKKGCVTCKTRRVKCSEERPFCRACRRLGLDCQYVPTALSLGVAPPGLLGAGPAAAALTFEDLRFFHHFLAGGHPPLPFGEGKVWRDVAAISHEYDFLAHAMMGLAAQDLTASTPSNYSVQALNHRVRAIAKMNVALSKADISAVDGDARLAAAMLLTFQSSNMEDGMMDFLRMLRGWMVIQTTVVPSMTESIFQGFTEEAYVESMRSFIGRDKPKSLTNAAESQELQQALEDFNASLRLVAPLCQSLAELRYLSSLQRVALVARESTTNACLELVPLYAMTNEMDADEFAYFTEESNLTAQILLAHFWMMSWILDSLGPSRGFAMREDTVLRWVERAAQRLPESHKRYVLWPLGIVESRG